MFHVVWQLDPEHKESDAHWQRDVQQPSQAALPVRHLKIHNLNVFFFCLNRNRICLSNNQIKRLCYVIFFFIGLAFKVTKRITQ